MDKRYSFNTTKTNYLCFLEKKLIFYVIFFIAVIYSCKKENSSKNSEVINKPSSANTTTSTSTNWDSQLEDFYQFTEGSVTKNIPDEELQNLGNLIDSGNFQAASNLYNIPQSDLILLKDKFYNTFNTWYNEIYLPQQTARTTLSSSKKSKPTFYDDNCRDIYNACINNSYLDYAERIGGCYMASIGVSAFTSPLGGGIFAVGCGLWAGRHRTNDVIICTGEYRNCH